jgi:hypothetical protein
VLYEFTFVVEGADPDDDEVVSTLSEHLEAILARGAGVNLLTVCAEGHAALDAALNAMSSAEYLVPQIRFLHLDRDLVGISEIAERTGRSRQNVSQWVIRERHATVSAPFPKVEGVVGRARIWLWSEVNAWLRALGLGDEIPGPRRDEITDIDFLISRRGSFGNNRPRIEITWPPASVALGHADSSNYNFNIMIMSATSHGLSAKDMTELLKTPHAHKGQDGPSATRVVIHNTPGARS